MHLSSSKFILWKGPINWKWQDTYEKISPLEELIYAVVERFWLDLKIISLKHWYIE